jgi:hypothetical protein
VAQCITQYQAKEIHGKAVGNAACGTASLPDRRAPVRLPSDAAWNLLDRDYAGMKPAAKVPTGIDEPTDRGAAVRSVALNRKTLPIALALLAGAAFVPTPTHSVTLGNIASQSSLGQPLRVEIPVVLGVGESLNGACLKLVADSSSTGTPQIVTAKVSLDQDGGTSRLLITTPTAVNEPALRLNLKAGCGSTVQRDYVLLLDPPGMDAPHQVASADTEKPSWLRRPRPPAEMAPPPRQSVAVAALPRSTWGTPVPTGPVATPGVPSATVANAADPKPVVPVAAAPEAVPRETVTLVSNNGGGFITEAGASSLTPRVTSTPVVPPASAKSLPLVSAQGVRAHAPPPQSVWLQLAPYAAIVFGAVILTLVAFMLQRRSSMPQWTSPASRSSLDGDTQAGGQQATFAHFGAMTDTARTVPGSPIGSNSAVKGARVAKAAKEETIAVSELDTLLQDIQADIIDERTIKDAWKAAAADSGDIGTDSILKAIAEAERDLQIGTPEPKQVALDTSLDNDLMTVPNVPKGVRFG